MTNKSNRDILFIENDTKDIKSIVPVLPIYILSKAIPSLLQFKSFNLKI